MPRARPLGRDEAALLVEAQRRGCYPATLGHLADGQHPIHGGIAAQFPLDFKLTLTCRQAASLAEGAMAMENHIDIRGLRVAVTGGTSGLGLALVRRLAAEGARIAFIARSP